MFDVAKTCRCCLVEVEDENELFEFTSEFGITDVATAPPSFFQIHTCYRKIVSPLTSQESTTSKICTVCLQELRAAFVFHQKSVKNCAIYKRKAASVKVARIGGSGSEVKKEPADDLIEEDGGEDLDPRTGSLKTEYVEYDQVEYLEPNDYLDMDYEEDEEDNESHDGKYELKPSIKRTPRKPKREVEESNESVLYCCGFCPKTFGKFYHSLTFHLTMLSICRKERLLSSPLQTAPH